VRSRHPTSLGLEVFAASKVPENLRDFGLEVVKCGSNRGTMEIKEKNNP